MLSAIIASLLVTSSPQSVPVGSFPTVQAEATSNSDQPVQLGDLPVNGTQRRVLIDRFVRNVAAPTPYRQLARWNHNTGVCVGVVNLQTDVAHYIADRVGDVARELQVRVGSPDCQPNIWIIASTDPQSTSQWLKNERFSKMVPVQADSSLGRSAFNSFVETDAPIRWWHTTQVAAFHPSNAIPGQPGLTAKFSGTRMTQTPPSRILAADEDFLTNSLILINPEKLEHLSTEQVTDLIAFVALAQVNPEADTSSYASILNASSYPDEVEGLTEWDWSYLKGLYGALRTQRMLGAARDEISTSIERQAQQLADMNNR